MRIVIIRGTHEELDGLRVRRIKTCIIHNVLADCGTNTLVIKCSVVRNRIRIHQQTVVSDDRNARLFRLSLYINQSGRVDRSDNQAVHAGSDHILNLGNLHLYIVLSILKVYLITKRLKLCLHVSAVVDPSLGRLGRHRHTNLAAAGRNCCCLVHCRVSRILSRCRFLSCRSLLSRCRSFCRRSRRLFRTAATAYKHGSYHCYAQKCA